MAEWRTIDSLPDNVEAILWQPADQEHFCPEAMLVGSIERKGWEHRTPPFWVNPSWIGGYEWESEVKNPTHWMPLPEPPR